MLCMKVISVHGIFHKAALYLVILQAADAVHWKRVPLGPIEGITGGSKIMKENAWLSDSRGAGKAELEALWRDAVQAIPGRGKDQSGSVRRRRSAWRRAAGLCRAWRKCRKQVKKLEAGDKVYACGMKKMLVLFQIGRQPLEDGMRILGAHIDSPRLDLKQESSTVWGHGDGLPGYSLSAGGVKNVSVGDNPACNPRRGGKEGRQCG